MAAALGFSRSIAKRWQAGLAVRAVKSEIASYKSNTVFCGDAGLTYTGRKAALGLAATNFGGKLNLGKEADPLPASVNAGLRSIGPRPGVVEAAHLVNEQETSISVGTEYGLGATQTPNPKPQTPNPKPLLMLYIINIIKRQLNKNKIKSQINPIFKTNF